MMIASYSAARVDWSGSCQSSVVGRQSSEVRDQRSEASPPGPLSREEQGGLAWRAVAFGEAVARSPVRPFARSPSRPHAPTPYYYAPIIAAALRPATSIVSW